MIDEARIERELAVRAAVLLQAIADLLDPSNSIRSEACAWIADELPSPKGYSFGEISDLLGIDRDAARRSLLWNREHSVPRSRYLLRHLERRGARHV
jgi:hypothetical protein